MAEDEKPKYSGVLHNCSHCGERCGGKYCKTCGSASGREEVDQANVKIMKDNLAKGLRYTWPIWNTLKIKAGLEIKTYQVAVPVLSATEKL
jgi:hypothetical protein